MKSSLVGDQFLSDLKIWLFMQAYSLEAFL